MASITSRKRKDGGYSYAIRASIGTDETGTSILKNMTWKAPASMSKRQADKQARKEADKFEKLLADGINVDGITFKELGDKYIADIQETHKPKTVESYRGNLDKINQYIGTLEVKTIKRAHIREFIAELEKPYTAKNGATKRLSASTIRDYYRTISAVLSYGCSLDYLENNVCLGKGIKLPKITTGNPKGIPVDVLREYSALMMEAPLKYKAFFFVTLSTGARRGEVLGLKWEDVDFENNCISINENSQILDNTIIFVAPKTTASARRISLPPEVMEMLAELKQEQNIQQFKLGSLWKRDPEAPEAEYCEAHNRCNHECTGYCTKHCKMFTPTDRVFTQDNGIPMYPKTPYDYLNKLGKKNHLPHITVHMLRHTAISQFIKDGNAVTEIASYVGHATPQVTATVYAHDIREANKAKTIATNMLDALNIKEA